MKQFMYVTFGGLIALGCGLALVRTAPAVISYLSAREPSDGTSISGIRRVIRYTASQEEDLLDNAAQALPDGGGSAVSAASYVIKDVSDQKVVSSSNADRLLPIASLTKLVTAITARRLISPFETITITRDIMTTYGNTAQFRVGETFTAQDLMYPLLMVSSNDAAEAFARAYGRPQFIAAMNEFAQSIGAYRTSFSDPSGLSPRNVSTANDIALILGWIRANAPDILSITDIKSKTVRAHTWTNPTHFLNWSNYIGGKNGYTDEAQSTGAALFSMGTAKDVYAVVVLGSHARDSDVIKLLEKAQK